MESAVITDDKPENSLDYLCGSLERKEGALTVTRALLRELGAAFLVHRTSADEL